MNLIISKALLTVVVPRSSPVIPDAVAQLDNDEQEIIAEYLDELYERVGRAEESSGWFQHGSDMPTKFRELLDADDERFLDTATTFITRLSQSIARVPNPATGLLIIATARLPGTQNNTVCTILKLDPKYNGARLRNQARSRSPIRLERLRELLPAPGELQKGLVWPDPRGGTSEVAIRDRNVREAQYFTNAWQVEVSAKPRDLEKALLKEINKQPNETVRTRLRTTVSALEPMPAQEVVRRLQQVEPAFEPTGSILTSPRNRGTVRGSSFQNLPLEIDADGIKLSIPQDRTARVRTRRRGGGWEIVITSPVQPLFPDGTPAEFSGSGTADGQ